MSLKNARPELDSGNPMSGLFGRTITTDAFYQEARERISQRAGLIHGKLHAGASKADMKDPGVGVCAMGAFVAGGNGGNVDDATEACMEEVREYNDSMPDVTPEVRKERVIGFLDAKIAARKVKP